MKVKSSGFWLNALIIETEAYKLEDKASHSSLGNTEKRKALFMAHGTIYMYYARGRDSLNFSCQGDGNAVLIKSCYLGKEINSLEAIKYMQSKNPIQSNINKKSFKIRDSEFLGSGQTLLCKSLGLKVPDWDARQLDSNKLQLINRPKNKNTKIIVAPRLGIPKGRDEDLFYRFILFDYSKYCTKNPIPLNDSGKILNYRIETI